MDTDLTNQTIPRSVQTPVSLLFTNKDVISAWEAQVPLINLWTEKGPSVHHIFFVTTALCLLPLCWRLAWHLLQDVELLLV